MKTKRIIFFSHFLATSRSSVDDIIENEVYDTNNHAHQETTSSPGLSRPAGGHPTDENGGYRGTHRRLH